MDEATLADAMREAMRTMKLKDAANEVADRFGASRRDLYQMGLSMKDTD